MKYGKLYKFVAPILRWLYRVEVIGGENIPEGGVILAANHTAFSDVFLVSVAANGRQVRYMAKKELFYTPLAPVIKAIGAFPVDRKNSDVASIKKMIALVSAGEAAGIFPQGTRRGGLDPRTTEIRPGIGMVAYHAKVPVVPILLESKRMRTRILCRNRVIIGKPIEVGELGFESGGSAEYARAARYIFDRICDLKYGAQERETAEEKR